MTEFDSVKIPLESWCIKQQDIFSNLPLLDTDLPSLNKQKEHFQNILEDILSHKDEVDKIENLSDKFSQHREVNSGWGLLCTSVYYLYASVYYLYNRLFNVLFIYCSQFKCLLINLPES